MIKVGVNGGRLPFDMLDVTAVVADDQPLIIHLVCQGAELQFLFLRVGRERENMHDSVCMYVYVCVHMNLHACVHVSTGKDVETTRKHQKSTLSRPKQLLFRGRPYGFLVLPGGSHPSLRAARQLDEALKKGREVKKMRIPQEIPDIDTV